MNIDETISAYRRGSLHLDCKRMVLCQNKEGGARFEGPGYIRQAEDGSLVLKLYAIEVENVRPLDDFDARLNAVAGQLHPDEIFYQLTAVGYDGTSWSADRILPNPHWNVDDGSAFIAGNIQSIIAHIERPQENQYLRLHFFQEYEIPLQLMSEAEVDGSKYLVLDRAEFNALGSEFEIQKRKGSGDTVIEVTSDAVFPSAFHLRIQEALQYITAKTAFWRVKLASEGDKLLLELASPWRKAEHTHFNPPISSASVDFRSDAWSLFITYLAYVVKTTKDTFWNPVAYHHYNVCEASANSVDAYAVGVSVAVEALASLVDLPSNETNDNRLKSFQKRMRECVAAQTEFAAFAVRMDGLIGMMETKRPQDTLYALAEKGFVEKTYVDALKYLRNRHVHPKPKDLQKPDAADNQKLLDNIHRVEALLRQVTFYLIGYKGPFTDYGAINFPIKQYPLAQAGTLTES